MSGDLRIGQGVDVHAFAEDDRPLMLGGVHVPGHAGLDGHSDGDAVLHAIVDALLGAIAAGDIGTLVGVDRPETAGSPSVAFLAAAADALLAGGWRVGNLDVTIVAQRPRLAAHRADIRQAIASTLQIDVDRVSVKMTTTDHLGFVGRGEGIAALAIATCIRPADGDVDSRGRA